MTVLPKSSTYRHSSTMVNGGYFFVNRLDNTYQFGPGFHSSHDYFAEEIEDLATPIMHNLNIKLGEIVNFGVLAGLTIKCLKAIESSRRMRASSRIGSRDSLHWTALGKVILSKFESSDLRSILKAMELTHRNSKTLPAIRDLERDIRKIVILGKAIGDLENDSDCRCVVVKAPISRQNLALSVNAPSSRLPINQVDDVARDLIETVNELVEALRINDGQNREVN